MEHILKQSQILKRMIFGIIVVAILVSPFSFSFSAGKILLSLRLVSADGPCGINGIHTPKTANALATCTFSIEGGSFTQVVNDDGTLGGSAVSVPGALVTRNASGTVISGPTSCESFFKFWSSPITCIGRALGAIIGGSVVFISAWFLTIAGVLFNWALNVTVVQFGQLFLTTGVAQSVTDAWTAFRDISNIIIIGMFTFIAICIILGIKEFGQKKLIANVLIIAVLINFSLLFSKVVIDASNFVSTQFYNAALNQSSAAGTNSTTQLGIGGCAQGNSNSQCYGIAGAFMDYAGISGFQDTMAAVRLAADKMDNGYYALLFAAFTSILFLGAALVLFYGTYLLISRAILFIFLMAVSALAFASYLVPVWDKSSYGFGAWKTALLNNALLAPLLMMFLWMTLNVANAMQATRKGGTLGSLLTKPDNNLSLDALFGYIVIMGLLLVSFKLSAHLASKISGLSLAGGAAISPFTLGSKFLAAPLARQVAGRYFARREEAKKEQLGESRTKLANLGIQLRGLKEGTPEHAEKLREYQAQVKENVGIAKQARRAEKRADYRFNIADAQPLQTALKGAGIPDILSGKSAKETKSFAGQIKERKEDASKAAEKVAPSRDALREAGDKAELRAKENHRIKKEELRVARDSLDAQVVLAKALESKEMNPPGEDPLEKQRDARTSARDAALQQTDNASNLAKSTGDALRTAVDTAIQGGRLQPGSLTAIEQARANLATQKQSEDDKLAEKDKVRATRTDDLTKEIGLGGVTEDRRKEIDEEIKQSGESRKSDLRHWSAHIAQAQETALAQEANVIEADMGSGALGGTKAAFDRAKSEHDAKIEAEKQAGEALGDVKERITGIHSAVAGLSKELKAAKKAFDDLDDVNVSKVRRVAEDDLRRAAIDVAKGVGSDYRTTWQKVTDVVTRDNELVKKAVESEYKKKRGNDKTKSLLADLEEGDATPAAPPPTAP